MFKTLSDERLCEVQGCNPETSSCLRTNRLCPPHKEAKLIAQDQVREIARDILKAQTSLTILDPVGGPKEAWIAIKMPWEEYEDLKKAAEGGE